MMIEASQADTTHKQIEIDGIDGCGKTTQCLMLADWWNENRGEARVVKELSSTKLGRDIRTILMGNYAISRAAEMNLFLASKVELQYAVISTLREANVQTISDRGLGSFLTYFRSLDYTEAELDAVISQHMPADYSPTVMYIDVDPTIAIARTLARGDQGRFDTQGIEYYERIRALYMDISRQRGWTTIDGSGTPEDVNMQIIEAIK